MPALARGQANTPSILNWFVTVGSVLTDVNEIGFRILDITGGLPGTQVFPASVGTYEPVTNAPGHFSTGAYYAFNNGGGEGWTPDDAEPLGTHRIEWRWKVDASDPYQLGSEDFEVLVHSAGTSDDLYLGVTGDLYIGVDAIRAQGLTSSMASDSSVLAAIATWQAFLERACRQWFAPKTMIIKFDGTDSDAIHFGVPIISIDYLKINSSTTELDPGLYKVYNSIAYPDDRRNPRIKLVSEDEMDIYTAPMIFGRHRFRKGRQNQEVKGTFGYVETDGSTPRLIKHALTKLVIEKLAKPILTPPGAEPVPLPPLLSGIIKREVTDGHSLEYAVAGGELSTRKPGLSGITMDQEILDIIRLYKAPIGIATPAHPSYN